MMLLTKNRVSIKFSSPIEYFTFDNLCINQLSIEYIELALYRASTFPSENTDFGMCVRGKFLRKYIPSNRYRSTKSGSNFHDHSTIVDRLSNLLETLPGTSRETAPLTKAKNTYASLDHIIRSTNANEVTRNYVSVIPFRYFKT